MKTVLLFLLASSVAMAQTAKSRADLYTEIDSTLASGGNITAAELRGVFKNAVASADNGLTDGTGVTLTGTETLTNKTLASPTFTGTSTFDTLAATTFNVTSMNVGADTLAEYIATLIDTSAELRAILVDESGTGALIFAGGNIGAATATTPAENDNDTSVATTAYVQTEIASISGLSGGMGALWPTADIASPPSGYFEAGLYGTTAQTALGSWSIIVKSLGTLATPTVSPAAGEIADGSTITFSSTDSGITFRHTTNGTDPTYTSGTTGATATLSGATTYEFIATKAGYPPSAVQSVTYTVPAGFAYYSAEFDGTNDYLLRGAGLTGAADGAEGTVSFWIKMASGSGNTTSYQIINNTADSVRVVRGTAGQVQVLCRNSSNTVILNIATNSSSITNNQTAGPNGDGWRHIVASWNLATPVAQLYVDGSSQYNETTLTAGTADYTDTNWAVGSATAGTAKFHGKLSEVYFAPTYTDLSVSGNRDKFYNSSTSKPAGDLLTNGAPAPIIYLTNEVGASPDWHTNEGSGGGFTLTGTLVDGGADKP